MQLIHWNGGQLCSGHDDDDVQAKPRVSQVDDEEFSPGMKVLLINDLLYHTITSILCESFLWLLLSAQGLPQTRSPSLRAKVWASQTGLKLSGFSLSLWNIQREDDVWLAVGYQATEMHESQEIFRTKGGDAEQAAIRSTHS